MKITRILALILALVICIAAAGCAIEAPENVISESDSSMQYEEEQSSSKPLLYKVTDDSGNVAWLFGSIHVGRDDFYPLPDYVTEAFSGSDALAVEFDIDAFEKDFEAQINALSLLIYIDGTSIKDHIPADVYENAVTILEENELYSSMLDYYMPSLWSSFIDNCVYTQLNVDMESGIDRYFIDLANENGKEIIDVESAQLQYGMLADFSEELQIYLLESSIESYGELEEMGSEIDEMMDIWASGDEQRFAEYLNEEEEFEDEQEELLYAEYNKAMLTDRNESMADFAEEALRSGKEIFICVGAAHVVGDGAIAEMLAQRGYNVEIVK